MSFEALLSELDELQQLAKSMPAEQEVDEETDELEGEGGEVEGELGEESDENMAKSMRAIVNGEEVEAIDGTELVKSLSSKVDSLETDTTAVLSSLVTQLKTQGELIKSLQAQVTKLSGQGRGKQSVSMTKSLGAAMTREQLMAKSQALSEAGRLSAGDVITLELCGYDPSAAPAELISKIQYL